MIGNNASADNPKTTVITVDATAIVVRYLTFTFLDKIYPSTSPKNPLKKIRMTEYNTIKLDKSTMIPLR